MLLRDGYFARFNKQDALARDCDDSKECFNTYVDSLRPPSKEESMILDKAVLHASSLLRPFKRLASVPWRFYITNEDIESGFPHTHGDYIIMPSSHVLSAKSNTSNTFSDMVDTLIHEKIHVFQRLYPCQSNVLYLKYWNLQIQGHTPQTPTNFRTNPDTNLLTYAMITSTKTIIASEYSDPTHPTLGETKGPGSHLDHPHEIMAYVATHIITKGSSSLDTKMAGFVDSTRKWLAEYA